MGNHQRNVGNYKSSFDGLGFSIAQLTREAPAFANSMQTGFMAISNNIPMLVDEINKLKVANQQLAASGKPTVSIFKQITKSLFGWQTLISVGVTLLTIYGSKLIDWAFGMTEAEKATEEATKALEEQNKSIRENIRLRKQQLNDVTEFINSAEIQDTFSNLLSGGLNENAGLALIELSERLAKAGVKNADLLKDQNITEQDRVRLAINMLEIEKQRNKLQQERLRLDDEVEKKNQILKDYEDGKISQRVMQLKLQKLGNTSLDKTLSIQARINQLEEENLLITGKAAEIDSENSRAKDVEREKQITYLDKWLERLRQLERQQEKMREDARKALEDRDTSVDPELQEEGERLERERAEREKQKSLIEKERELIKGAFMRLGESLGIQGETISDLFDSFAHGFTDAGQAAEQFGALFSDVMNAATKASNARIQERINQLSLEKEIAMQFAGDSAAAREEIEKRYDEKVAKLKEKQAKNNKANAIVNSVINTANCIAISFSSDN